jgi:hypothetical protein
VHCLMRQGRARRLHLPRRADVEAVPPRVRSVSRIENDDALDRMAQRLAARPDILDRRREIVEHPFGSIKQWMNQGAFLMRGVDNVRAEFSLTALTRGMFTLTKHAT